MVCCNRKDTCFLLVTVWEYAVYRTEYASRHDLQIILQWLNNMGFPERSFNGLAFCQVQETERRHKLIALRATKTTGRRVSSTNELKMNNIRVSPLVMMTTLFSWQCATPLCRNSEDQQLARLMTRCTLGVGHFSASLDIKRILWYGLAALVCQLTVRMLWK